MSPAWVQLAPGPEMTAAFVPSLYSTIQVFAWAFYLFPIWAVVLLVIGVRTVHGWSWWRSIAGVAFTTAIAAALALAVSLLYAVG